MGLVERRHANGSAFWRVCSLVQQLDRSNCARCCSACEAGAGVAASTAFDSHPPTYLFPPFLTCNASSLLSEGIAFDFGGLISATGLSHAYLEAAFAAGSAALQDKVVEAFFRHYFEQKGDIGDNAALHALALGAGVPADAIAPLLDPSKAAAAEVAAMASAGTWQRKYRISGVPHFIINGRHSLGGAQEPARLVEAIRAAAEEMA